MILWATPTSISGEGTYPLPGDVARLEITAHPGYLTSSSAALPRYRGLGQLGFTVGGLPTETTAIGYLDTFLGPFPTSADGLYILLSPGVTANLYRGYEMSELNQPSAVVAITTTHNLVNTSVTTITWQAVENGVGQIPQLSDLRNLIIPVAGLYLVNLQIGLPTATYTELVARVLVAGAFYRNLCRLAPGVIGANGLSQPASALMPFAANDSVRIQIGQTSGADRLLDTNTRASLVRVANL